MFCENKRQFPRKKIRLLIPHTISKCSFVNLTILPKLLPLSNPRVTYKVWKLPDCSLAFFTDFTCCKNCGIRFFNTHLCSVVYNSPFLYTVHLSSANQRLALLFSGRHPAVLYISCCHNRMFLSYSFLNLNCNALVCSWSQFLISIPISSVYPPERQKRQNFKRHCSTFVVTLDVLKQQLFVSCFTAFC